MGQTLPKGARLLTPDQYAAVFRQSACVRGEWLDLRFEPNRVGAPRLGIAVGRKVAPRAVCRNAIKRILRERFRRNRSALPPVDLVFILKKPAACRPLARDAERLLSSISNV